MDDDRSRPLSAVVGEYRPAPASFNRSLLLVVLAAFWSLFAVFQAVDGNVWRAVAYVVLAAVWVSDLRSERHPRPATVVTRDGLRVRRWTGRWREVPWSDVERVSLVRDARWASAARLVGGRTVRLVGVPRDVAEVLARHVRGVRAAPAEG